MNTIMDDAFGKCEVTSEYRIAGPYEYYIDKWTNKVKYIGESRTTDKVLIALPLEKINQKSWSNH